MIRSRRASLALSVLLFSCAAAGAVFGAEAFAVAPPLDEALPWADSPEGVKVAAPFLLNPTTIVPAGAVARFFYVRPLASDDDNGSKIIGTAANKEAAYTRQGTNSGSGDDTSKRKLSEVEMAVMAAHRSVWPTVAAFRAALVLIGGTDLRFIYKTPGATEVSDQPFAPAQGLLLTEKDGAVLVCGVVQGSNADRAGFAPGDRLDALNGASLNGSLATFVDQYAQVGAASTISKPKPYQFHLRHAGSETPADIAIRPPPSLGGSLLDQ